MRALPVALIVLCGCRGAAPPRANTGVIKHRGATAESACVAPTTLSPVPAADVADPEAAVTWRRETTSDPFAISDGAREYSMTDEGTISATEHGTVLWRVPHVQVAGGAFGMVLSPKGSFVVRQYSRGGLELFDARDGRLLRKVGAAVPSPDDRFVVELPRVPFGLDAWDHDDVRYVPLDPKQPVRTIVRLPLSAGEFPEFGAAVSPTGELIAVSFPTTELAIYCAADLQKLASVANPGAGAPTFTRSGRYVVLRADDTARAAFELVR